jgi:hypothetical protein
VIAGEPSSSAIAGQPFAIQPVVYEVDRFGNLETGDNTAVVTAVPNTGAGPLSGATATLSGGIARFVDLADVAIETLTLKFTAGALSSGASSPITVGQRGGSVPLTVTGASETAGQVLNAKGQPTGPKLFVYTITFSTAIDPTVFGNTSLYEVDSIVKQKKGQGYQRLPTFPVTVSGNTVRFMLKKPQKFALGGRIVLSPTLGITNPTLILRKGGKSFSSL